VADITENRYQHPHLAFTTSSFFRRPLELSPFPSTSNSPYPSHRPSRTRWPEDLGTIYRYRSSLQFSLTTKSNDREHFDSRPSSYELVALSYPLVGYTIRYKIDRSGTTQDRNPSFEACDGWRKQRFLGP